ncbi:helix-turn-helix domain-containing protein, partial [Microvirga subterranea]
PPIRTLHWQSSSICLLPEPVTERRPSSRPCSKFATHPLGSGPDPFPDPRPIPPLPVPGRLDVAAIRHRTGLAQPAFARRIGVSLATLRNWEQGHRSPTGPARVLLALVERNLLIVEQTLST